MIGFGVYLMWIHAVVFFVVFGRTFLIDQSFARYEIRCSFNLSPMLCLKNLVRGIVRGGAVLMFIFLPGSANNGSLLSPLYSLIGYFNTTDCPYKGQQMALSIHSVSIGPYL